jgi:hypothetical protein
MKEVVAKAKEAAKTPSRSEWIGLEKEKLSALPVLFKQRRGYQTRYGWTNVYTFTNGENVLVWLTTTAPAIIEGEAYLLDAVIKEHKEYKNEKQTVIKNCKFKEV